MSQIDTNFHVKYPLMLYNLNETRISLKILEKIF